MFSKVLIFVFGVFFSSYALAGNALLSAMDHIQASKTQVTQVAHHPKKVTPATQPYALVVFFRSTCPHCQRFTPIVKQVASDNHLKVYAYSTDGGALPAFPTPLRATPSVLGTFFTGLPEVVPTVFLINTNTMGFSLVTQGEESSQAFQDQLNRIFEGVAR